MENHAVARILENIADILELQEVAWKPQAYRRVAQAIATMDRDINKIHQEGKLKDISGVGEAIEEKLDELLRTGKLKYYEKLKKQIKIDLESLKNIPELGPKKIKRLYLELKIKNIKDLERAIKQKKVRELSGFGERTEKIFHEGIKLLKTRRRFPYYEAAPIVNKILKTLNSLPYVERAEIAGSFRRKEKTVGDLDVVVVSKHPELVMDTFTKMKDVLSTIVKGQTKSSVRLKNGLQVDLRVVSNKQFGAAWLYFTGNKAHNIELRKIALKKGWTLNEYALSDLKTKKILASKTEEEIYDQLELKYINPIERLNRGEIKKYKK